MNKYDEGHFEETARRVVMLASAMIAGDIGIIEGTRVLASLGHAIAEDFDPDFMPFVAIDSETDHLPVGNVRELWSTEALRDKDKEINESEKFYKDTVEEACLSLLADMEQAVNISLHSDRCYAALHIGPSAKCVIPQEEYVS